VLSPLCGVFYPITVLPDWLQAVSWVLPPTYVFEGMRAVVMDKIFRADLLLTAIALNLVYLAVALIAFLFAFRQARERGQLLQTGE
jgi:ABC-2 type transport system permease protein